MIKNPLHYPVAILAGCICLFIGARILQLPSIIILPIAIVITIVGAIYLQKREANTLNVENRELEREIQTVNNSANSLASQAKQVNLEATKILTDVFEVDVLATLQIGCSQAIEAPIKIDNFLRHLRNAKSLLSIEDLKQQLAEVERKALAKGTKTQLIELAASLRRNIKLAEEGRDTRLLQVYNISTQIQNCAGILQQVQTKLVNFNSHNFQQSDELKTLANQLITSQESIDLLIHK
ncbi:hypothetical protein NIES4071_02960 [Calothrix sp. NIES-4071]|nr:hypothetical protein NIES4071_02960 [Calothrix sp. NIES-4071]BAZ54642.1 hypothetical protein NIES4105_02950 [Calothrix sp. NIES-4105]